MPQSGETPTTALVVEDDESLADTIRFHLEREGFRVLVATDGLEGLRLLRGQNPGVMILDLMLPGMDGWELCRRARDEGFDLPIIVCSARASEFDKVETLGIGADDYLVKPFGMAELVARVRAGLRRARPRRETGAGEPVEAPPLVIDPLRRDAFVGDEPLGLTPKELALLHLLAREAPRPLSREEIYRQVWGYEMLAGDRSVDVFVRRLRQKLADAAPAFTFIQTRYGFGYWFERQDAG